MDDQPIRKMQNSVRYSILHDQSAAKSHNNKHTVLGSSRKDGGAYKRPQFEKKQHIDQKGSEQMLNELYSILVGLNANYKEMFKKAKLKVASKQTFNEVLAHLLANYDPNMGNLNMTDEEVAQFFRDLGYPYYIRDDVLKIIGAPHSWQQAILMLHWLAQVVEVRIPGSREPENTPLDEFQDLLGGSLDSDPPLREDNLFDLARKGIERKVRADELATNYLQQQDIPAEERKVNNRLKSIADDIKKLQNEIEDCKSSQAPLIEIRKSLSGLISEVEKLRSKQEDVKLAHMRETTRIEEEKFRLEQKQGVIRELEDRLKKLEGMAKAQPFDVDSGKRMIHDTKEFMAKLMEGKEILSKRKMKLAELNTTITNEKQELLELTQSFNDRLKYLQHLAPVQVTVDSSKEQFKKAVSELQTASEVHLTSKRQKLEEQATIEVIQRETVESLTNDIAQIDRKLKDLDSASKKLKDKMTVLEKDKSSKERDFESKKLNVNNEIISLTNQLDRSRKECGELEFEFMSSTKEATQAKTVIHQGLDQLKSLIFSMKHTQIEKIRMESERIEDLKLALVSCMKPRSKY